MSIKPTNLSDFTNTSVTPDEKTTVLVPLKNRLDLPAFVQIPADSAMGRQLAKERGSVKVDAGKIQRLGLNGKSFFGDQPVTRITLTGSKVTEVAKFLALKE